MRVLLIKTSSMGDLIHTFPALTDAGKAIPGIRFDWMVEDAFAVIPTWHPLVNNVIPVALRRWRKGIFSAPTRAGFKQLHARLKTEKYDLVLDAQGLVKSAFLSCFAHGPRAGLDWSSAREALASLAYQQKHTVNFYQHAVVRMRSLFSSALGYVLPTIEPEFGLNRQQFQAATVTDKYLVFLPGTTWVSKQWPENYWIQLAALAGLSGYRIKLSGGNDEEMARAHRIAASHTHVDVLPRIPIPQMAELLAGAQGVVAVDTGFGHLAGALDVPTVSIYGSTNPAFTGALGKVSIQLSTDFACSPCLNRTCTYRQSTPETPACYTTVPPNRVWNELQKIL